MMAEEEAGLNPAALTPSAGPSTISELACDVNKNKAATEDLRHVYTSILTAWGLSTTEAQWVYPALNRNHRSRIQSQHDFMEVTGF